MLYISYNNADKTYCFYHNRNKLNIHIKDVNIFVCITIVNNSQIYIRFYRLLDLMNFVFEYTQRYVNLGSPEVSRLIALDVNNEYMTISNVYKNDLYAEYIEYKNHVNILPNKIISNILYIKFEFIYQFQYKLYHNYITLINVLTNNEFNYTQKYVYLYTPSIIKFKMLNKTFLQVIKLHYQNKSNFIKDIIDNDMYFQNELYNNYDIKTKKLLYYDIIYNWKEIYFNYKY